jgi:hypothetical protein
MHTSFLNQHGQTNQNLIQQPAIVIPNRVFQTIAEVPISKIFSKLNDVQKLIQKISNETIEQLITFILQQSISDIYQIILFLAIFHGLRPHQSHLITEIVSIILSSKVIAVSPQTLIHDFPVLASKLYQSGILSHSDVSLYSKQSGLLTLLIFPSNIAELIDDYRAFPENPIPRCFKSQFQRNPTNFPINDIRKYGYQHSTIGYYLKYDQFDGLQQLSAVPNFSFEETLPISPCDLSNEFLVPDQTLISVAAFYGSIHCFKFLSLNHALISASVCRSSVQGGNNEIIRLSEQNHGDFIDCLPIAVSYLRNDVADWLLTNYPVHEFTFNEAIQSFNFPAISYLLENHFDFRTPTIVLNLVFQFSFRFWQFILNDQSLLLL